MALSGGHTAIYKVASYTDFSVVGTTRDDAIGESFDKIGRLIGIEYPAGKGFDLLSKEGYIKATGDEEAVKEARKKVSQEQARMRAFIEDTGRVRRYDREQIAS
jgi:tRNA A37 threonylcarbamoyltransferase TsaD